MNAQKITPANFTRRTANLPEKFRRERRFALVPLYHLLRLSDLAREGIERSGSFRFADHLYRNEASGTGRFGRWLDRRLLNLAASKAMRSRYAHARDEMQRAFEAHLDAGNSGPFRILTVPCGIPRDAHDFAERLAMERPGLLKRLVYAGMDLDPEVIESATAFLADSALQEPRMVQGNALDFASYRGRPFDFISSTGLGEFLGDDDLAILYGNIFEALAPGGTFFTSAAAFDRKSDALLRTFELNTQYRDRTELDRLLSAKPWKTLRFERHPSGLQTYVCAIKS